MTYVRRTILLRRQAPPRNWAPARQEAVSVPRRRWLLGALLVVLLAACIPGGIAFYRYSINRSLVRALDGEDVGRVHSLLRHGGNVSAHGRSTGFTALHFMAWNNEPGEVEWLIRKGSPIEARDKDGYTPLMTAAIRGNAECLERFLAHGADPTATNDANQDAVTIVAWMSMVQWLSRQQNSTGKPGLFGDKRTWPEVKKGYERTAALLTKATQERTGTATPHVD